MLQLVLPKTSNGLHLLVYINLLSHLQQLQILLAINRMPETLEPLQRELQLAPDVEKSSVMAAIPRLYARATDKRGAADLVAQVLQPYTQQKPLAGAAWATIGRMRLAAEDVDATFQAAQQGLRADADCIPCGKRLRCNAG